MPRDIKTRIAKFQSFTGPRHGSATGEEALAIARSSSHAATNRRLTGIIKIQAMAAILEPELAAGRKVITFQPTTTMCFEALEAMQIQES